MIRGRIRPWLRAGLAVALGLLLVLAVLVRPVATLQSAPASTTRGRPPGSQYSGNAFNFTKVADGVYIAVGTGALSVVCNAGIIVTENEVMVVDTHISPAAAWALREELKTITPKPIRYVVNTHFHVDHAHGNQIYGPDVEVIGHEFARERLLAGDSMRGGAYDALIANLPNQLAGLKTKASAATGPAREKLEAQLAVAEQSLLAANAVKPTPPNVTLSQSLTLFRGGREIRLLFLGRGHTGGDVVVFLPRERVAFTGDLQLANTSYMGDSYPGEWADTLERLKALEFDTMVPGHGTPFSDKARITYFQAYLRDFWKQMQTLHAAKVPMEEAEKRLDMSAHAKNYPSVAPPISTRTAVQRAYELLSKTAKY